MSPRRKRAEVSIGENSNADPQDPTIRVVGSAPDNLSAEAERAARAVHSRTAVAKERELTPEEIKADRIRDEALTELCKEIVEGECTIAVLATGDPRWREKLSQKRLDSLAYRWNIFFKAWGIQMAGPIAATIALTISHTSAISEVWSDIQHEDIKAKDSAKERIQ